MRVFTQEFCRQFLEEVKHFESDRSLSKGRPNTMNNYGVSKPWFHDRHNYVFTVVCVLYSLSSLHLWRCVLDMKWYVR